MGELEVGGGGVVHEERREEGPAVVVGTRSGRKQQHGGGGEGGGGRGRRRQRQGRKLVVGMKSTSCSREMLAWVIAKLAQPGDHILAVHVAGFAACRTLARAAAGIEFCSRPFSHEFFLREWGITTCAIERAGGECIEDEEIQLRENGNLYRLRAQ